MKYYEAIRTATDELLSENPDLIVMGQGLWSPFYVGKTMEGLEVKYSKSRVIDTPVSENCVTAMSLGFALCGGKAIIVHPRMDFMILSSDAIVNSIAKWRATLSLQSPLNIVIRVILNRGGGQGAQHSQALYSWYAHIPGLRILAPSTPNDAYRFLKWSLVCGDPVLFIEDRWDYEQDSWVEFPFVAKEDFYIGTEIKLEGEDISLLGVGHTTNLALQVASLLKIEKGISAEVIDLRSISPIHQGPILESLRKTRHLLVLENAWSTASISSEVLALIMENSGELPSVKVKRLGLPPIAAPVNSKQEKEYYLSIEKVFKLCIELLA